MKTLKLFLVVVICAFLIGSVSSKNDCPASKRSNSKLICYYGGLEQIDGCYCTHVILPSNADVKGIEKVREEARGVKIYVTVNEFNQGLINLLKDTKVDGLEIDLKKLDSKNDISDFISTVKTRIGSDLSIALSIPSKADLVAKYFDFKALSKHADLFILQTGFLGASTNVTFHPSRLSGMWDMQNTDSVVDLVSGLGAPLSKLVITAPVQAFQFKLQSEEYTAPGSPALELASITRDELCRLMKGGKNWTLERDEDQAGPYIFSKDQWIAFEDTKSIDIKAKYSRIRGLAGIALKDLGQDGGSKCGTTILEDAYNGLSRQARAPRGAVLHSLEREYLESPSRPLDSVQLSPFSISRVIDTEGKIHVVRQDSRTEFKCSRQGYFVHPRSCNRFYRCVKFNQQTEDYNVFEFDCPAGLAFDERVEVCVWPGSLPHGTPCSGSSEIAPVPRERFVCPTEPGYYPDPENCRWFFACLDHGKSPLSAYEFRCPFGLVFDGDRLVCEWPWLVPRCAQGLGVALDTAYQYGSPGYSGYSRKGGIPASVVLQNYNGLGSLGTVKLGGLSGTIERPISTVYSNADGAVFGSGYKNDGGYITGGGLNFKAFQSLQNAGLLKLNNGAEYGFKGQSAGFGNAYSAGVSGSQDSANANQQGGGVYYIGANANNQYHGAGAYGSAYSGENGAQSYAQYHGTAEGGQSVAGLYNQANSDSSAYYNQYGSGQYSGDYRDSTYGADYSGNANGKLSQNFKYQNNYNNQENQAYSSSGTGSQSNAYVVQGKLTGDFGSNANQGGLVSNGVGITNNGYAYNSENQGTAGYTGAGVSGAAYASQGVHAGLDLSSNNQGYVSVQQGNGGAHSGDYLIGGTHHANAADGNGANGAISSQSFIQYHGNQGGQGNIYTSGGSEGNIYTSGAGEGKIYTSGASEGKIYTSGASEGKIYTSGAREGQIYTSGASEGNIYNLGAGEGKIYTSGANEGKIYTSGAGQGKIYTSGASAGNIYTSGASEGKIYTSGGGEGKISTSGASAGNIYTSGASEGIIYTSGASEGKIYTSGASEGKIYTSGSSDGNIYISDTGKNSQYSENDGYNSGIAGNINIVGGGYSAVGAHSGVYVSNNGESNDVKTVSFSSTPAPVTVTTFSSTPIISSIPTVTSVPVPGIKTNVGFETFKGGVIANVPELQYKVHSQSDLGLFNISSGFANVVVTTPSAVPTIQQSYSNNGGYVYNKPINTFEEGPVNTVQISTARPFVAVSTEEPKVYISSTFRPTVQVHGTEQNLNYNQQGVTYSTYKPKPHILETYSTVSTVKPAILVEQPQYIVSSTPVVPTVSTYKYNEETKQNSGYVYNKPSIVFEEGPKRPAVTSKYTNTYTYQQPTFVSQYEYKQPNIQPAIYKQPTSLYTYKNVLQQAAGISTQSQQNYSYANTGGHSYQYIKFDNQKSIKLPEQGYAYPKPSITFEEQPRSIGITNYHYSTPGVVSSTPQPIDIGYDYAKPTIKFEKEEVVSVQPAVVNSYYHIGTSTPKQELYIKQENNVGYSYPKPTIKFEENPVTYVTQKPIQSVTAKSYFNIKSSTIQPDILVKEVRTGYSYPKPSIKFEETPIIYSTPKPVVIASQPAVVTSYYNTGPSTPAPEIYNKNENIGYVYPKPEIKFEETPVVYSTPKTLVQPVQPAVVSSYFNIKQSTSANNGYAQEKNVGYVYQKPGIKFEEVPVTYSTPKPAIDVQPSQPTLITSYYNSESSSASQEKYDKHESYGYTYSNPEIKFEERPVVYSTPKPAVVVQPAQPAIVTSYFNTGSSTPAPELQFEKENVGYTYPKPVVKFEETPVVYSTPKPAVLVQPAQPAVVTSYFSTGTSTPAPELYVKKEKVGYNYPKPAVKFEETPVFYSTPKPPVVYSTPKATVISSYNYISSTTPQPNIVVHDDEPVNYNYLPPVPKPIQVEQKPAVVTSYFNIKQSKSSNGYNYPRPAVSFKEEPQNFITEYENKVPVQEVPFVKKTAYVTGDYKENYQYSENPYENKQTEFGEKIRYYQPEVTANYVPSTPKPTFSSVIRTISKKKYRPVSPAIVTSYDSRYSSTPESYISSTVAPEVKVYDSTSRYGSKFSFLSMDTDYQYNQYADLVKSTTSEPSRIYLPVTSTVRVTTPIPQITKSKVVEAFVAPEVTTIAREYLPVRIRTKAPAREYLPVEVTSPSREYFPVRQRVKVTSTTSVPQFTTVSKEYLPAKSRVKISTPAPVYVPKTIIKQSDAHPLLSSKLGAQCTCVSNTLKLRKNQRIVIVDDDEGDDDDGYIVDDNNQRRIVESYSANPEAVVEITPTPEIYSSTTSLAPKGYAIRKRIKVRPYNPVTEVSEIFIKKNTSPVEDTPSDKEIVKAVRTGLKLVKQAAKEGAKEGTQEALSGKLDRYGSGGVRSRSETLQGTIDCQRAGLFRHPTECNKFYACRWDCTKNRFTLHVFNCPVQLTFDNTLGACNWPSQGPACVENTLITSD
ncbi:uncharacterized protein LOC115879415 [Sitophilus oryzae]|uniref:Uncharacterized protein LOC115879415 n=1 Tax=Sitophilus oryzae TaxID=7048 RepID=A0A6J2XLB7_SITOR|nr:uncharacterized protein LOC115879415 [Sitophilus oryzae]